MDSENRTTGSRTSDTSDVPTSNVSGSTVQQQRVCDLHDCIRDYRAFKKRVSRKSTNAPDTPIASTATSTKNSSANQRPPSARASDAPKSSATSRAVATDKITPRKPRSRDTLPVSSPPDTERVRQHTALQVGSLLKHGSATRHDSDAEQLPGDDDLNLRSTETGIDDAGCTAETPSPAQADAIARKPSKRGKRRLRNIPVWFTSAAIHALLLVALALLTIQPLPFVRMFVIRGQQTERESLPDRSARVTIIDSDLALAGSQWATAPLEPLPSPPSEPTTANASANSSQKGHFSEQTGKTDDPNASDALLRATLVGSVQFCGIQARGNRIVFIVDGSGSMVSKFEDVKRELENAVRALKSYQQFYVIFFNDRMHRMRFGKWDAAKNRFVINSYPEPALAPATAENKDALVSWMNTITPTSRTYPAQAFAFALRNLEPNVIFLLSDGELPYSSWLEELLREKNSLAHLFEREYLTRKERRIRRKLRMAGVHRKKTDFYMDEPSGDEAASRSVTTFLTDGLARRVTVHCVGFYSQGGERTLKHIAEANGGTYRFVAPPKEEDPPPAEPRRFSEVREED